MKGRLVAASCVALLVSGCAMVAERAAATLPAPTLMTLAPVVPPDPLVAPPRSRSVPDSIDATGEDDVVEGLQDFLDSVPDDTTIVFPPDGRYRLSTGLVLDGRHGLYLKGNGTTLLSDGCDTDASAFTIGRQAPSSRIVIRGFGILGANSRAGTEETFDPECQFAHGVSIQQSADIEITDVAISRVHGDCVFVGGGGRDWSEGIYFHDSTCELTGRQGVAITAGSRVRVERVVLDQIGIIAFDIEPDLATEGARDVAFIGNTVGMTGISRRYEPMFFGANGNLDAEVRDVTVANNAVTGESLSTLVGDEDKGWNGGRNHFDITFVGNRSSVAAAGPVLTFKHVDGLTVYGNQQQLSSGPLIRLVDTVNTDIR